jgi:biotin carboxyl carrier protein
MKRYNIKVNGITYEVEVEEIKEEIERVEEPTNEAYLSKTPQRPEKQEERILNLVEKIESPIPGTVINVNVNPGDNVKKGQVLFMLESMKMENEIMAPYDGNILEVNVVKGANVNTGHILAVLSYSDVIACEGVNIS